MSGPSDWTHLSDPQVRALVEGALSDAEAEVVARHLDECPRCAARATGGWQMPKFRSALLRLLRWQSPVAPMTDDQAHILASLRLPCC
jgi:anti-sigma factor RsiW